MRRTYFCQKVAHGHGRVNTRQDARGRGSPPIKTWFFISSLFPGVPLTSSPYRVMFHVTSLALHTNYLLTTGCQTEEFLNCYRKFCETLINSNTFSSSAEALSHDVNVLTTSAWSPLSVCSPEVKAVIITARGGDGNNRVLIASASQWPLKSSK